MRSFRFRARSTAGAASVEAVANSEVCRKARRFLFDIIVTLGNTPGLSFKELGQRTLITKGTLTGVVDSATFTTHAYVADPLVRLADPTPIRVTVTVEKVKGGE